MPSPHDVAIIGAGAAGLMAAIAAGRAQPGASIVALEGARKVGAKILVSGGSRCNVTHDFVDEQAFAGASRKAIRKVLLRFDVAETTAFFAELGVELKREETGKLFPVSDSARSVVDALLGAARSAGVEIRNPWRVDTIERVEEGFRVVSGEGELLARRVVLATGGKSLPKSGSDGVGYGFARALGHSITDRVLPALVPLTLPEGHFVRSLAGITLPTRLEVRSPTGKRLAAFTDSTLCTHFGLSGPSVLDVSRWWLNAQLDDADSKLCIAWLPGASDEEVDRSLRELRKRSVGGWLRERFPDRLAIALAAEAEVDATRPGAELERPERRRLVRTLLEMELPIDGDRGFKHAEVTAGGVPLTEVQLKTMESRLCSGLHLCGEILDVDGRIGGYNFQWAWASGHVAGAAAAKP